MSFFLLKVQLFKADSDFLLLIRADPYNQLSYFELFSSFLPSGRGPHGLTLDKVKYVKLPYTESDYYKISWIVLFTLISIGSEV